MSLYKLNGAVKFAIASILLGLVLVLHPHSAHAASTYTVNSIGDDPDANPGDLVCESATPGECTLRAAIQEVNAGSGGDTINFGIAGTGVHTLTPASAYDTITQAVTINGYSQPGSAVNTAIAPAALNGTLTIEIDGSGAGLFSNGLRINSSNVTVKGLVINRFSDSGIQIDTAFGGSNVLIQGNYLGTDTVGSAGLSNNDGVSIDGGATFSVGGTNAAERNLLSGNLRRGVDLNSFADIGGPKLVQGNLIGTDATGMLSISSEQTGIRNKETNGYTIGGTTAGAMNVISGNAGDGIQTGGTDNTIQGNYIGLDITGVGALPNLQSGITMSGSNNIIGGTTEAARNVISNNGASFGGITMYFATTNTIQGNYIGTDKNGVVVPGLGNNYGILILNESDNNLIGGTAAGEINLIAGNDYGVLVMPSTIIGGADPINISVVGNDIEQNSILGIHLAIDSDDDLIPDSSTPVPNDAGDPDSGPNMFMNYPVINSATKGTGQVTVNYDLDINPAEVGATGYSVDFYANSTNTREGAIYLGSDLVPGSVTGRSATLTLPGSVPADYYVTAVTTMIDVSTDGYGHSSEFSAAVQAIATSPTPDPPPSTTGTSTTSSSLANTGQPQNTNQRLFMALALIIAGLLGIGGLTLNNKRKKKGRL